MSSNDHAHDMSLNDPVHDMSSTDPAADRAAARDRSVARWRNGVSARIALFQDAFSAGRATSSVPANTLFVGGGYFPVVSAAYSSVRRQQRMRKRKFRKWVSSDSRSAFSRRSELQDSLDGCECEQPNYQVMCTLRVSSARGSRRPHAPPKVPPCHHEWMPVRPAFPDWYAIFSCCCNNFINCDLRHLPADYHQYLQENEVKVSTVESYPMNNGGCTSRSINSSSCKSCLILAELNLCDISDHFCISRQINTQPPSTGKMLHVFFFLLRKNVV
ncbi:uncharacterized protein LOC119301975 isoform X2 [Triticum dicoccoides]|uniref:uncharacterized protein LOC119301975 isoform X2 n=1 Tax=Triticum dicoccoides TaxID=85692 RepID=UPI00188E6D92|nr:uncharacterized protein LOC119301975 isoform X2 [Triticum dicoccoides]